MIDYEKEYRQIHRIAAELHLRNDLLLDRLDSQKEEIEKLRAENEMLIVSVTMIERMAAGTIYSQEAIHASAIGALKRLEGKP